MDIISEVLGKNDYSSKLMGDIIRVLSLSFGRLWLSELVMEIRGFRRSFGESGEIDADEIAKAVKELKRLNVLETEEKFRSSLISGSVPDLMVKLLNVNSILNVVRHDQRYLHYIKLRDAALRDLKGT